ncbi:unnamed protein product, partial [Ectocarpus sp. 8 AP-2014]
HLLPDHNQSRDTAKASGCAPPPTPPSRPPPSTSAVYVSATSAL